ncbi:MAG: lytic transglycosylase domain-containing protein [Myxococcota bacterium]
MQKLPVAGFIILSIVALPLAVHSEPLPADFPIPNGLEGRIWFWEQIFGRYDSDKAVLHDRESPEIVWQVIDLPSHPLDARRRQLSKAAINSALADLRTRLRRLEKSKEAKDEFDEKLLDVVGSENRLLVGASTRVRSQQGVADKFRAGLERSKKHISLIYSALDAEGVPRRLAALPFIESMFTPKARSHAGAAGLWQLMPATARGLGLRVTRQRDDRLDVARATKAAARMLRDNYRMLGSWPLAITGYNHGPYGVKRATQQLKTKDLGELIERYQKSTWGFASKNFYAEFIAAARLYERATAADTDEIARGEP